MKIANMSLEALCIPFKQSFSHSSTKRHMTESVLVTTKLESGHVGYGEGCPRSYVTGETVKTAKAFFEQVKDELVNIGDVASIFRPDWIHRQEIDQNPACWCAIELSILDAMRKETLQSPEALLGTPDLNGKFSYTAVLGTEPFEVYLKLFHTYLESGFSDFKIKISGIESEDKKRLDALKCSERPLRIRIDANSLWDTANQAITYVSKLDCQIFAIEDPLNSENYESCRAIYSDLGVPIILDENFLRRDQFTNISDDPECWIVNLRVSKMGGLARSLLIAQNAKDLGIPLIVGAQVGETSILTRAGLTIANAYQDILLAQEGAFGTHLLEFDIVKNPIMFGAAGKLDAQGISDLCVVLNRD